MKLNTERCRKLISQLRFERDNGGMSNHKFDYLDALEIALPILEQQEVMRVPAYYIVYHPNPDPHEYDDKEHSHCGSIHLAKRLAGEIGGSICPVYIGDKLEQQERGEGEWIEWVGSECPVDGNTMVQIRWSDDSVVSGLASSYGWTGLNFGRIAAYRIIPEQPTNQNGEQ